MNTKEAMEALRVALHNDDGYAITWHSNIAMACYYAVLHESLRDPNVKCGHDEAHRIGNEAASRFLQLCFNVRDYMPIDNETKQP